MAPEVEAQRLDEETVRPLADLRRLLVDQRKAVRLRIALPFTYQIDLPTGRLEDHGVTQNISGGGVMIRLPQMVSPQTACQLWLKLPDHLEPVAMRGRTIWCRACQGRTATYDIGIAWVVPREHYHAAYGMYCQFIMSHLLARAL